MLIKKMNLFDRFLKDLVFTKKDDIVNITYKKNSIGITSASSTDKGISVKKLGDVFFSSGRYYIRSDDLHIRIKSHSSVDFSFDIFVNAETKEISKSCSSFSFKSIIFNPDGDIINHKNLQDFPNNIYKWSNEDWLYYILMND